MGKVRAADYGERVAYIGKSMAYGWKVTHREAWKMSCWHELVAWGTFGCLQAVFMSKECLQAKEWRNMWL